MRLLYITANPKPVEASFSLQVGAHFLQVLQSLRDDISVEKIDVYQDNIPFIDAAVFAAWGKLEKGEGLDERQKQILGRMSALLEQFMHAETYVFVTPLWNLSYPPLLKAYIDNVVVANKTFAYTPQGPQGLLKGKGKRAVHIQAAGGIYSTGPVREYSNDHLQTILAFMGIEEYHHVLAEGMAYDPSKAPKILEGAKRRAEEVAKLIANASPTSVLGSTW